MYFNVVIMAEYGMRSAEHGFDFVVEGLVVKVIDFDSLEVLFGVEVSFGD
jgi:hypothetical protein